MSIAVSVPEEHATQHAIPVFATMIAAMALMPLAVTGTNLAFPSIERAFDDVTLAVLAWTLSGYGIANAAFQLLGGQLSDRFDARRIFLAGLAVFGAASMIAGAAPHAGVLIAGRAIQGAGGALVIPSSLVLATAQFPAHRHPMVIGVWTASFPIGSALAPSLTAVILQYASWRWVFFGTAICAGLVAAFITVLDVRVPRPRTRRPGGPAADITGILIGTGAVGLLALGISQGPDWGWSSARTVASLAVAVALLPVFVMRSLRHPMPMMDLRLFRIRSYSVGSLANVFISIAGTSVWLVWPLVMINRWGYSQLEVGLAITPTPALAGTVSVLSLRWTRRHGHRGVLIAGSLILVAANAWYLARLGPEPDYVGVMLPGLILYGIGMGLTFAPVNAAALLDVDPQMYGQANAGFSTGRSLAGALGIAATIAALGPAGTADFAGFDRAFLFLAVISVSAALLLVVAWPRRAGT